MLTHRKWRVSHDLLPGVVSLQFFLQMQCGNLIDCGIWFPVNLFAIFDAHGKKHLPRVCWRCQGIELEPAVVAERNEYESYLRKQEEAAQALLDKELAAKAAKEALKNPPPPVTPKGKRGKSEPAASSEPPVETGRPSRSTKKRRASSEASALIAAEATDEGAKEEQVSMSNDVS